MPNTKSGNKRKKSPRHHAGDHGLSDCPLCRKYPRFNADTLAAFKEADEDERYFRETGKHLLKRMTFDEYLAEVAAL